MSSRLKIYQQLLLGFLISLLAVFTFSRCFIISTVVGPSMEPTLSNGCIVLINQLNKTFKRNSIVVFNNNDKLLVKRILATPGDHIQIEDSSVVINDITIDEPYIKDKYFVGSIDIILEANEFFVLGDNRNNSLDSRDIGPVKINDIIGSIFFIWGEE